MKSLKIIIDTLRTSTSILLFQSCCTYGVFGVCHDEFYIYIYISSSFLKSAIILLLRFAGDMQSACGIATTPSLSSFIRDVNFTLLPSLLYKINYYYHRTSFSLTPDGCSCFCFYYLHLVVIIVINVRNIERYFHYSFVSSPRRRRLRLPTET